MNQMRKAYHLACRSYLAQHLHGKRFIIRHVRQGNRIVGTLLAVLDGGGLLVGWSKCHRGDPFHRAVGTRKAYDRRLPASAGLPDSWRGSEVPAVIRKALEVFLERAGKWAEKYR